MCTLKMLGVESTRDLHHMIVELEIDAQSYYLYDSDLYQFEKTRKYVEQYDIRDN